jgi:hypothetical protein
LETDRRILPAFLLCLLFGTFGAHAFYARRWRWGIVYVAVIGFFICTTIWREESDAHVAYNESYFNTDPERIRENFRISHGEQGYELYEIDLRGALEIKRIYEGAAYPVNLSPSDVQAIKDAVNQRRTSDMLRPIPAVFGISLAILLIVDLVQIITGTFRDGEGMRIVRWT